MRTGHLFAGIDGIGLGLEPHGFDTAWFSEYEAAPSRVLAHHYPDVPNHGDITAIDWSKVEPVDVLTGGFPCQDLSYAGKGAGIKEGTRSGLWFEYVRAIRALRPRIVIVENVAALLTRGIDVVLGDLAACGFDASWSVLRASDVGAAHRRERLFIVAHANASESGLQGRPVRRLQPEQPSSDGATEVADSYDQGLEGIGGPGETRSSDVVAGRSNGTDAADTKVNGRPEGGTWSGQRPRRAGLAPGNRGASADRDVAGGQARSGRSGTGDAQRPQHLVRSGTDWGQFAPAIRQWEQVTGRPAPAPTVDGRLSADFTEWHMGFPPGWTSMLSRNERLKALGNAVVPQCADVIGRWALDFVGQEVAA